MRVSAQFGNLAILRQQQGRRRAALEAPPTPPTHTAPLSEEQLVLEKAQEVIRSGRLGQWVLPPTPEVREGLTLSTLLFALREMQDWRPDRMIPLKTVAAEVFGIDPDKFSGDYEPPWVLLDPEKTRLIKQRSLMQQNWNKQYPQLAKAIDEMARTSPMLLSWSHTTSTTDNPHYRISAIGKKVLQLLDQQQSAIEQRPRLVVNA